MRYILALIIAVMVSLVLSHTSGPSEAASPQWEDREIGRLSLVISHPDFNQSHNNYTGELEDSWATHEQLTYENGSKWVSAHYEYIVRPNTYLYVGKFKERFEWYSSSGQEINITEKGDVKGLLGDYDFVLYTVTNNGIRHTDCVGVAHSWERYLGSTQDVGRAYDKRVTAVFCDYNASFSHLKNVELQRLINSVGVKKYKLPTLTSMPKKSEETTTNRAAKTADSKERCTVADLSGEWKARGYNDPKEFVTIVVDGTKFIGTKLIGDSGIGAGQVTVEGNFKEGLFSEAIVWGGTGGAGEFTASTDVSFENGCNEIHFDVTYKGSYFPIVYYDKTADETPTESKSTKAKLKELKELLDDGLITEEEAAAKRAKLLEDM